MTISNYGALIARRTLTIITLSVAALSFNSATAADQCNTTAQCKAKYGSSANDCKNSASANSICMCGSTRCDAGGGSGGGNGGNGGGGSGMLGSFDKSKDLLLLFFDNKPDADDIHSQAAIGTMLKDSRFSGIKYWGVLGAYGKQNSAFLNSSSVMTACLGGNNWVNAHPKDKSAWNNALNATYNRVKNALNAGGDIWVAEAGQSDFTADLVRKVKSSMSVNTRQRIHVVQHSQWNENQTTASDLNYVRNNTDYKKIADGNAANNGTPQFKTNSSGFWGKATSLPKGAGACWAEARRVADANNYNGNGHWENPAIEKGGIDCSDTVEVSYITGFNYLKNMNDFFNTFPK